MPATYLAKDRFSHPIQVLKPGPGQNVTLVAATTVSSVPISGDVNVIRLFSTVDVNISVGETSAVGATSTSFYLPAFTPEYIRIDQPNPSTGAASKTLAAFGSAAGTLNIVEML